jgi:hypothetical protein
MAKQERKNRAEGFFLGGKEKEKEKETRKQTWMVGWMFFALLLFRALCAIPCLSVAHMNLIQFPPPPVAVVEETSQWNRRLLDSPSFFLSDCFAPFPL